jgi:hypothetical protein
LEGEGGSGAGENAVVALLPLAEYRERGLIPIFPPIPASRTMPGMTRCAVLTLVAAVALLLASCTSPPKAAQEDIDIRDQWAAKVPPEVRAQAQKEIDRHPGWGERRKLEFEVREYQKYLKDEDRKARLHRPTTRISTTRLSATTREAVAPTTAPATNGPTTRSTHRSATRRAATSRAATLPAAQ